MIKRGGSAVMAKEELPECPVATAVSLIGGKWKLLIIRNLRERPWRFNELRRDLEGISPPIARNAIQMRLQHYNAAARGGPISPYPVENGRFLRAERIFLAVAGYTTCRI